MEDFTTEVATTAAKELANGILNRIPESATPYIIIIIVILFMFVFVVRLINKSAYKHYENSVKRLEASHNAAMDKQQEMAQLFLDYLKGDKKSGGGD